MRLSCQALAAAFEIEPGFSPASKPRAKGVSALPKAGAKPQAKRLI
jgi:hypothetical protein